MNAVDSFWNVVTTNDTVGITATDPNAVLPANAALAAGTQTFSVTLKTGGSRTVTATLAAGDFTAGSGTLSSNYTLPTTASGAAHSESTRQI